MILSIHQPAYLPWLGYFDRIAASDAFVVLDTVQLEKNSFTNRNRIKTANGPVWLTVPVFQKGHMSKPLREIEIDETRDWRRKHVLAIAQSYARARRFPERFARLSTLIERQEHNLTDLCVTQLAFWLGELGIKTPVVRASDLDVEGTKSDLVLGICQKLKAGTYISGPLGRGYLDEAAFARAGIRLIYHDYAHPTYPQLHGEFMPLLSVVDWWLNAEHEMEFGIRTQTR